MNVNEVEVFRELSLVANIDFPLLRERIIDSLKSPWSHAIDEENGIKNSLIDSVDIIVFSRKESNGIDESSLTLWQMGNSYRVANIVPKNIGELGIKKYNIILNDFYEKVISPKIQYGYFNVKFTSGMQSIDDWLDESTAEALSLFSRAANKYTGASHPLDEARWHDFLIKAHKSSATLQPEKLARWLSEIEMWPDEIARDLAINYEFSRGLLKAYDKR